MNSLFPPTHPPPLQKCAWNEWAGIQIYSFKSICSIIIGSILTNIGSILSLLTPHDSLISGGWARWPMGVASNSTVLQLSHLQFWHPLQVLPIIPADKTRFPQLMVFYKGVGRSVGLFWRVCFGDFGLEILTSSGWGMHDSWTYTPNIHLKAIWYLETLPPKGFWEL